MGLSCTFKGHRMTCCKLRKVRCIPRYTAWSKADGLSSEWALTETGRKALGASPARLIRQLTTEAVMLTLVASLMGIGSAYGTIHLLRNLLPIDLLQAMPYLNGLGLNMHVLLFAGTVGVACLLLLSTIAILRSPLASLRPGLAEAGRGSAGTVWKRLGANHTPKMNK
jgi:hypothetical protein